MPNIVTTFDLDGTQINVQDGGARTAITTLTSDVGALQNRVTALEALSRLSISYNASTETITFTTGTHS